jgi:hypothetical protein
MSNLATIVNNILADSGIDDINVVVTTGSYTNPAWIVSLPWTKITGTPTTLAGYGITDAYTQTQVNNLLNAKLSLSGGTMTGAINLPNGIVGINVGDDATISDRNVANTMYVAGIQNTDRGYINFSETGGNQLGAINGGDLTWRGVPIITTSNVSGTVDYIPKFTAANSVGNSALREISGNLGLGIAPSSWSNVKVLQIGATSIGGYSNTGYFNSNAYYNSTTSWTYVNSSYAARYELNSSDAGIHKWYVAPTGTAGATISFITAMTLNNSGQLGIGVDPTQMLDVNGNGKFRGQDLFLGSDVTADNVIYIYSKNGAQSQIRTNAGVSSSYNGMMIASNYNQAASLPSWSLDLGGALNSTGNVNTFTVGYKPFGGAWASLMIVNANGDTVVSNNFTSASAVFNNGTNSTNGIKVVSSTTASVFTGGIEFIRTTVAGGSKIQPLRDAAIGGVGFDFLVTTNNAAEIAASYTSALSILNTGVATFSNNIFIGAGKYLGYSASAYVTPEDNIQGARIKTPGGFLVESAGAVTFNNLAGTGTRMVVVNSNGVFSTQAIGSGSITGSGTTNYVPKFTSSSAIGNSVIIDSGSDVTVGNALRVNAFGNVAGGTIRMGAVNDGTEKWSYLVSTQYNSSSNPQGFSVIGAYTTATANQIVIGGSIYEANPATEIQFWTHTAVTHGTGGSKRMTIDTNGNVGINTATPTQKFEVSGGAIIASGFGNRAAGTGKALEIGMDGTNAVLQALDRTANAFIPIAINSSGATFNNSVTAVGLFSTTSAAGNLAAKIRNGVTSGSGSTGYGLAIESEASAATSYALTVRNLAESTTYFHISTETGKVGYVGIGTTSSNYRLQVGDLTNTSGVKNDIFITGDTVNTNGFYARLIFGNSNQSGGSTASIRAERITTNFATELTFYTNEAGSAGNGAERLRIASTGNIGINTANPLAGLQIEKYGSKFDSDVQYNQPAGNVFLSVTGAVADQVNWFGMRGSYNSSTGSANLLLQANYRDVNSQAGHYISSKAQSLGVADFIIGKLVTTTSVSTPPTLVPQLTIAASGAVTISNNASPGLNISKDASLDNRYLRLTNTQASSVNWDLINQQNSGGNSFLIYNATASTTSVEITPTGNMTARGVIGWYSGIGALSYGSGFVTMETNTANAIQFKTNGTTALTLQTNQNGRFANLLGIGRDPSHALDALGSIRGSDRLYWNGLSQLVYILNYDQINNADTTTISDSTATNGFALRKSGGSSTFFFGNYTSFPPGNYTAYFRLKVASNASGSSLGTLDVVGGTMIGFAITLRPNMFAASDTWQYIKLPFTVTGSGYIEWRLVGWTGITDTFFDHIMVYQEGGEGNVFTRSAYSVYVNQNTLGMQLNTSGALTVTSSVTATSFFESSDERLKSNIIDLDANVSSIIAKSYLKNGMQEIGYLAQDVERILPSAISKRDDGYLDLSYRQVHTAKIAALEKEVFELKQQLKNK